MAWENRNDVEIQLTLFDCFFFLQVPASVTVENRTVVVKEGDNVTLHCISSGLPRPNVSWVNASSYIIETGSVLNLTNISRHIPGFNCSASNACGNDSRKVDFDVQCES